METKIFCLEGITGAGKTTQASRLSNYLSNLGKSYLIINEKRYSPFKETIINWHNTLKDLKFSKETIFNIAKSRGETHRTHFLDYLGKIDYLIFDRNFYTSGIYQSDGELSVEEIIDINLREGAIRPEKGLVLLCLPDIALKRITERRMKKNNYSLPSINETLAEIAKRKELYLKLIENHSELSLMDTNTKNEDELFEEVKIELNL